MFFILFTLYGCGDNDKDSASEPIEYEQNGPDIQNGELVYNQNCIACHFTGDDVDEAAATLTDEQLIDIIANGIEPGMPPQTQLSDSEILDIVVYIRSR